MIVVVTDDSFIVVLFFLDGAGVARNDASGSSVRLNGECEMDMGAVKHFISKVR